MGVDDRSVYLFLRGVLTGVLGATGGEGSYRGALVALEACLALEGDEGRLEDWVMSFARWERAQILQRMGREDEATKELRHILSQAPGKGRRNEPGRRVSGLDQQDNPRRPGRYELSEDLYQKCSYALGEHWVSPSSRGKQ